MVQLVAITCRYARFQNFSITHSLKHGFLALTFVLAPLPNTVFSQYSGDEFSTYEGSGLVDFGRFLTSTIVVTGFALPIVLTHSEIIRPGACVMSIVGGAYVLFLTL